MMDETKLDNNRHSTEVGHESSQKGAGADFAKGDFAQAELDPIPDGGWQAWGVVLGVSVSFLYETLHGAIQAR
jgi:hypothetical protein